MPPDLTIRPAGLAKKSKIARLHFTFRACDEDGEHFLWDCKYCHCEVRTTWHVSLLATHINGNDKKARVKPCAYGPKGNKTENKDDAESSSDTEGSTESAIASPAKRTASQAQSSSRTKKRSKPAVERAAARHNEEDLTIKEALEVVVQLKKTVADLEEKLKAYQRAHTHADGYHGGPPASHLSRDLKRRRDSTSSSKSSLSSLTDDDQEEEEEVIVRLGPNLSVPFLLPVTTREPMAGDGNCGFRAAAYGVWGDQSRWKDLREALSQQLELGSATYQREGLWTAVQEAKLQERLKADDDGAMASTAQWFGSIDCCVLLADLCACPVVVLDERIPNLSNVTPPSLSTKGQASISALSEDQIGHFQGQAIVLVFNTNHWDFVTKATGTLPPLQRQWVPLRDKLGGARASWDPVIASLKEAFPQGFTFRLPVSAVSVQPVIRRSQRNSAKDKGNVKAA
ncbi:hypothetical protein OC846_006677 [Tilletia horrida]|uniref:OTU domain-containing protein n=1 Tax=Tilletia horrida TaxID=155126 RepID=A0AAN6JNT3_9BASI|nr:hypothetical protein OC845_006726 [Tilletia horrida]KAK0542636.1 hypothetical protein OC846_006677 [Tilletia horrida]KAK0558887.1 hypothetical protein OC861_006803 [Tilletia horrida]